MLIGMSMVYRQMLSTDLSRDWDDPGMLYFFSLKALEIPSGLPGQYMKMYIESRSSEMGYYVNFSTGEFASPRFNATLQ